MTDSTAIPEEHAKRAAFAAAYREHIDDLPMITTYANPKDYPEHYVARLHICRPEPQATLHMIIADTETELDDAIKQLLPGLQWVNRYPDDDRCILGVWL